MIYHDYSFCRQKCKYEHVYNTFCYDGNVNFTTCKIFGADIISHVPEVNFVLNNIATWHFPCVFKCLN